MTIRKILVPLVGRYDAEELKQVSEATLQAGLNLGRDLAAYVEVCCSAAAWHDPREQLNAANCSAGTSTVQGCAGRAHPSGLHGRLSPAWTRRGETVPISVGSH